MQFSKKSSTRIALTARSLILCLALALLAACTSQVPEVTRLATSSGLSAANPSVTPFNPLPSATPSPSSTPEPTSTATHTPLPTSTATLTPDPAVRFAVIGDFGAGNTAEQDVANLVESWNPDFIITVGDNNYPDGSAATIDNNIGQYYHEFISPYAGSYGEGADQNRFFPTLGNHDWNTDQAQPYIDYFTLPNNERYYDFTWGPVHFFALSSDSREPDGVSRASIQATWLQERLAVSQAPWKIVYMHHPPYSSGTHGPVDWMQWPFAEWGASAVLSGHDHTYERLEVNGIPYFINGLGGASRYDFPSFVNGSQVRYRQDFGAMRVVADSQQMTFEFITRTGETIDTYSLNR